MARQSLVEVVQIRQWHANGQRSGKEIYVAHRKCVTCGTTLARDGGQCEACYSAKRAALRCSCGNPLDVRSVTGRCRSCWTRWKGGR